MSAWDVSVVCRNVTCWHSCKCHRTCLSKWIKRNQRAFLLAHFWRFWKQSLQYKWLVFLDSSLEPNYQSGLTPIGWTGLKLCTEIPRRPKTESHWLLLNSSRVSMRLREIGLSVKRPDSCWIDHHENCFRLSCPSLWFFNKFADPLTFQVTTYMSWYLFTKLQKLMTTPSASAAPCLALISRRRALTLALTEVLAWL